MGTNTFKWQLAFIDNLPKIVIPYTIDQPAQEELDALDFTFDAINQWHASKIVQFLEMQEYHTNNGVLPERWVHFTINNQDHSARPCVWVCTATREPFSSHSLQREFSDRELHNLFQQLRHILGLGHTQAASYSAEVSPADVAAVYELYQSDFRRLIQRNQAQIAYQQQELRYEQLKWQGCMQTTKRNLQQTDIATSKAPTYSEYTESTLSTNTKRQRRQAP